MKTINQKLADMLSPDWWGTLPHQKVCKVRKGKEDAPLNPKYLWPLTLCAFNVTKILDLTKNFLELCSEPPKILVGARN